MGRKNNNRKQSLTRNELGTRLSRRYNGDGSLTPLSDDPSNLSKNYKIHRRIHIANRSKKK